jgi:hypothetical protein
LWHCNATILAHSCMTSRLLAVCARPALGTVTRETVSTSVAAASCSICTWVRLARGFARETTWSVCGDRIAFALVSVDQIDAGTVIETGIVFTIININLALGALESRRTWTGTLADTIDWYSAIQTLDIVDFALVDVVFAIRLGGAIGTIDAFVRAN